MSDDLMLKLILQAKDSMSSVVRSAVRSSDADFEKLQGRLSKAAQGFDNFGKNAIIAGGAITAMSGVNLKLAADFEDSMASVSTLVDTGKESISDMSDEILKLSKMPVALNDLTEGLYNIRSAGRAADEQFLILEKSAKLGVAGLGSTNEAVDLVTSSLNAFQLQGKETERIYDTIFKVVKYGKTNISGLAQGFGATAGTVAAAKIKVDDYLASVAALTTTGQPAAQAHTQLKAAIAGMTRETKESAAVFKNLHVKNFKELVQKSGGMVNAFKLITEQVKGNDAAILKLFGSTEAFNAVIGLTTTLNKTYTETLNDMRNGSDLLEEGYIKKTETMNAVMKSFANTMQRVGIEYGMALIPAVKGLTFGFSGLIDIVDRVPKPLKAIGAISTTVLGVGLLAVGSLSMACGAAIKGFSDMMWAYRKLSGYVTSNMPKLVTSVKLMGLNVQRACLTSIASIRGVSAAIMTTPVIGWVAAAITGVAFLVYKYWEPLKGFFSGLCEGAALAFVPLKPAIQALGSGVSAVITAIGNRFTFLRPVINGVSMAVNGVKNFFVGLLKPVRDVDNSARNMGKTIGFALSGAVNWCVKLIEKLTNVVTLGGRVKIGGNASANNVKAVPNGSHAAGLDRVPFDGYIAETHKNESILNAGEAAEWRDYKSGKSSNKSSSVVIHYSPEIKIEGGGSDIEHKILNILKNHATELASIIDKVNIRKTARSYVFG